MHDRVFFLVFGFFSLNFGFIIKKASFSIETHTGCKIHDRPISEPRKKFIIKIITLSKETEQKKTEW